MDGTPRRADDAACLLVAAAPDEAAAYVFERLESGRGLSGLSTAGADDPALGESVLLASAPPDWLLGERFVDACYLRVGSSRVFAQPGAAALKGDEVGADRILLVDRGGPFRLVRLRAPFAPAAGGQCEPAPDAPGAPAGVPPSFDVSVRLAPSASTHAPELWILPKAESPRLEGLISELHEDEHGNLLVAPADDVLVVRELAGLRRGPRFLPASGETYYPLPGSRCLYARCGWRIAPRLPAWLVSSALGLGPSDIAQLDPDADGRISAKVVSERDFSPAARIIDLRADEPRRLSWPAASDPWRIVRFEQDGPSDPERADGRREDPRRREPTPAPPMPVEAVKPKAKPRNPAPQPAPAPGQPPVPAAEVQEPARDDAEVAELERALADDPEDHEAWSRYAALAADEPARIRALEEACWHASGDEREAAWAEAARASAREPAYAAVAAIESRAGGRALDAATAAAAAWRAIDASAGSKKRRWILWSRVAAATGDALELERRREALLGELARTGIRDHELPRFLRKRLLERYSGEAAKGHDPARVAAFLDAAETAGLRAFGKPGDALPQDAEAAALLLSMQASFGASLSVRWLEAGMLDRAVAALAAAEAAAKAISSRRPATATAGAVARVAAAQERVAGPGAGAAAFRQARAAATSSGLDDGSCKMALVAFVKAAAPAGQRPEVRALVAQALATAEKLPMPIQRISTIKEVARELAAMGLAAKGAEAARATFSMPKGRKLTMCEYATSALAVFGDGRIARQDAETVIALVREMHSQVDEFTPHMLRPAFSATPDPWAAAQALAADMRAKKDQHASLVTVLAGLGCLAEAGDRDRGLPELERAFRETLSWRPSSNDDALRRMRLIVRLSRLAPQFGARERGMAIVKAMRDAAAAEQQKRIRTEIICAAVACASKLGVPDEASRLLDEVIASTAPAIRESSSDSIEILTGIVDAAALIGDSARGLGIVRRSSEAAEAMLSEHASALASRNVERALPRVAVYQLHRVLVACSKAAMLLGDLEASKRTLATALAGVERLEGADRTDVATATAKGIAELPPEARSELGLRALAIIERAAAGPNSTHARKTACDAAERLVADVASGETAFSAAVTRWVGDEERRIRDRVAAEQWLTA